MARNNKSKKRNNSYRPNFWGFLQNVLIASMNKGQLPVMGVIVVFIIILLKYPSDELPELLKGIASISKINSILGWILFTISTFTSYFLVKWQRKIHTKEIQRISNEKRQLQQKLSTERLPSSN